MPFTDMPLYWGGAILLFAPWALMLKRDRTTIFLTILAALAWIVSFGKFLPLLYWPLFEFLPYFNKFRVPSLIQVLVLLPAVVLAGRGLQALWEKATEKAEIRERIARQLIWIGGTLMGVCFFLLILQAALRPAFMGWIMAARPQMQSEGAQAAFGLFTGDLIRLLLLTGILYGSGLLVLKGKWPRGLLIGALALTAVLELTYFDRMLVTPTPPQQMQAYLQADDVTQFLQKQTEPYRILPLTQGRNPDWYMAHRIESVLGYTGAKPRLYQEAIDSLGYNNFSFLKMLNTRFIVHDKPINNPSFEEVFAGRRERVSRFKEALPRTFLVNRAVIATPAEILQFYRRGDFDFGAAVALERAPSAPLEETATGTVTWISREPDQFQLEINSSGRQMLVLSEPYYPSGWSARVDGQPIEIHKVNYLFRGIEIPAGNHRVEMQFVPLTASTGNLLKWIALVGMAAGLLSSLRLKRRGAAGGV
jgi:hypothetical protein